MNNWLGLARAIHYGALTGLFGLCLFRQYGPTLAWSRPWGLGLSLAALASGVAWFVLKTADLAGALGWSDLAAVGLQTGFGNVWIVRMVLTLGLVGLCSAAAPPARTMSVLSGVVLMTIALTGHTQIHDDWRGSVHVISDAIHLAGAGAWLGGLIGLSRLFARVEDRTRLAFTVERFSAVARIAVAALVLSGLVNAFMVIGRYDNLLASQYVRQLLVKLAFVGGMLLLALINRFALTPRLAAADDGRAVRALRRNVLIEQALGVLVLLSVGWLGMSDPPA
ncbi:MAG TPA: copper homeostasis membrane protein CopD [Caulobacteraceae bacterium]|nr:copper homeostasis membrane protein CopD [Caulobacteraceae bacterium]